MNTGKLLAMAAAIGMTASALPAAVIDLTTLGTSAYDDQGAYFEQIEARSTGSGNIHPFVRISGNGDINEGMNTDGRPLEMDENNSQQYTHSLRFVDVPVVNIGGTDYLQFLLDINQFKNSPLLSISKLEIYLADAPDITNYNTLVASASRAYTLGSNAIKLNYTLNTGSGSGDMLAYIPRSSFTTGEPYLYVYSEFGRPIPGDSDTVSDNDGYQEWAIIAVPEPSTAALGLLAAGMLVRRSRRAAIGR